MSSMNGYYKRNTTRAKTSGPFSRTKSSKFMKKGRAKTSHKHKCNRINKTRTSATKLFSRYTKSNDAHGSFTEGWFQPYEDDNNFTNNKRRNTSSNRQKTKLRKKEILRLIETTATNHIVEQNALRVDIGLNPEPLVFSQHLNDLLIEEEVRRKKGKLYKHFSDKVDSMLKGAMKKYYKHVLQAQERKWTNLQRKQNNDWIEIKKIIEKKLNIRLNMDKRYNLEEIALKTARDEDDFDAQVRKMEQNDQSRYFANEKHNLKVALKNQLERLDSDWDNHIRALELEYETIRIQISGITEDVVDKRKKLEDLYEQNNKNVSSPYRSKEKQDQLIHTAPVLRPTKRRSLYLESHTVNFHNNEKKKKLNELNLRFQEALKDIKRQKLNAAVMIKRRNTQINIQLEFTILIQDKIKRIIRKDRNAPKVLKSYLETKDTSDTNDSHNLQTSPRVSMGPAIKMCTE
jgi:hypothetical protein